MKPVLRGYIPYAAFIVALVACSILLINSDATTVLLCNLVYSLTLIGMYGVSTLYHYPTWSRRAYLFVRSIDHAAIFALIAGTATPICIIGLKDASGMKLLYSMWAVAIVGMIMTIFWTQGPKWVRALLYIALGWFAIPDISQLKLLLGMTNFELLVAGGLIYTIGALIYAFKRPNPFPNTFSYHEIFHVLVVIASIFHFTVIYNLTLSA